MRFLLGHPLLHLVIEHLCVLFSRHSFSLSVSLQCLSHSLLYFLLLLNLTVGLSHLLITCRGRYLLHELFRCHFLKLFNFLLPFLDLLHLMVSPLKVVIPLGCPPLLLLLDQPLLLLLHHPHTFRVLLVLCLYLPQLGALGLLSSLYFFYLLHRSLHLHLILHEPAFPLLLPLPFLFVDNVLEVQTP